MDFKPISGAWPNSEIAPDSEIAPSSDKFGLVEPHRLLTWVWSTPKQAISLITTGSALPPFFCGLI